MTTGSVGVLNVGAGDTKLTFDKSNPIERARAARIVKDMLRRGYVLFIQIDDGAKYQRVLEFNEEQCEYIIADIDPEIAVPEQRKGLDDGPSIETETHHENASPSPGTGTRKRGRSKRAIPAETTKNAVAVPRIAGG